MKAHDLCFLISFYAKENIASTKRSFITYYIESKGNSHFYIKKEHTTKAL